MACDLCHTEKNYQEGAEESIMKKKILFVSLASIFGGGEVYLLRLLPLIKCDTDIIVVCVNKKLNASLRELGFTTYIYPCESKLQKWLRYPVILLIILYIMCKYKIDAVHLNGNAPAVFAVPAKLMMRQVYITAHCDLYPRDTLLKRIFMHRRYLMSLQFCDHVICVTEAVRSGLSAYLPKERMTVIQNWVSDIQDRPLPPENGHTPFNVLFVGRLVEEKGLHVLIDAIQCAKKNTTKKNIVLTVVGEGKCKDEMVVRALNRGITSNFVGFQADTFQYYREADIFVNPSYYAEGSSLVAIEAMAHGIPCILSDIDVFKEVSANGKAALLFQSKSVEDLSAKLVALLGDDFERRELGRRGLSIARENFSARAVQAKYLAMFRMS